MDKRPISIRIIDTIISANAGNAYRLAKLRSLRAKTLDCHRNGYPDERQPSERTSEAG